MCGHQHHHDHDHDHDHGHDHGHQPHSAEPHRVRGGAPVLDIGGDIGALVMIMNDTDIGSEVFLRPDGQPAATVHTAVWPRRFGDHDVATAVFLELTEGRYWVLDPDGVDRLPVDIVGGQLSELSLE